MTQPEPKDQIPCCENCTNDICERHPNVGKKFPETLCWLKDVWDFTAEYGCLSHPQAREYLNREIIFSREFHLPKNFPSIKQRQIAYKDFEDGGESWNSISNSPMLEDGDIIQIIRTVVKVAT